MSVFGPSTCYCATGFTIVEQVAAVGDVELLNLRHVGMPTVTAVRDAIAAMNAVAYPINATIVLVGDQIRELVSLLSTLKTYADARRRDEVARLAQKFLEEIARPRSWP